MDYTLAKALHIVGFISWFSGLFYIVRLFVYHAEAGARPEPERAVLQPQLELMAQRLWRIITVPAMVLTLLAGTAMVVQLSPLPTWLHVKFGLLAGLVGYTLWCGSIRRRQADPSAEPSAWTSNRLRLFNEVGTLFMVAIVFLAVFRSALSMAQGVVGLVVLGAVLMLGVRGYRMLRERKNEP